MSTHVLVEVDGQKLRRLRKQQVMLIADLARESGVHRNIISKLESGKGGAYPETIRKLAQALGVESRELVKVEE